MNDLNSSVNKLRSDNSISNRGRENNSMIQQFINNFRNDADESNVSMMTSMTFEEIVSRLKRRSDWEDFFETNRKI